MVDVDKFSFFVLAFSYVAFGENCVYANNRENYRSDLNFQKVDPRVDELILIFN